MRWLLPLAASVIFVALPAHTMADDKQDCLDHKDHELTIKSCSAIIRRDPDNAIAYHNRGNAYGLKGDLDRAIADYNKVIELKPNYAPAYESRGRAYASKGDYTHAVADVTRASELVPKPAPRPKAITPASQKTKVVARANKTVIKKMSEDTWPAWASHQSKVEN